MSQDSQPQPIGTCLVVVNSNNQVLLGKRKNSYKAGFWGLPGGRIELGESIYLAASRELTEETGLEAGELFQLAVIRDHQTDYDFIHFAYGCNDFTGLVELREPDKCEQWLWFDWDDLPEKILRGHRIALEIYRDRGEAWRDETEPEKG